MIRLRFTPGAAPIADQLAARGMELDDDGTCQRLADALGLLDAAGMLRRGEARAVRQRIEAEVARLARKTVE